MYTGVGGGSERRRGSYAAIGDSFFWGRSVIFCRRGRDHLALAGTLLAPLAFLLLYTPAHLWVRGRGFSKATGAAETGLILSGRWIFRKSPLNSVIFRLS